MRLEVEGFPFISQDTDATVCAESALWMVLRYYNNKYPMYPEKLPFEITKSVSMGPDGGRPYPSSGRTVLQLSQVLQTAGLFPLIYSKEVKAKRDDKKDDTGQANNLFDERDDKKDDTRQANNLFDESVFFRFLYVYIESGFPVLLTLKHDKIGHVVVAFGHLSSYLRKDDSSFSSSRYNHAFIINDDNGYPYQSILENETQDLVPYKFEDILSFIVPLPEKVFLFAENAEESISAVLGDRPPLPGFRESVSTVIAQNSKVLENAYRDNRYVRRLFLTTSRAFKRKLNSRKGMAPTVKEIYRDLPMPHYIWVCELADSAKYPKEVLGEVIWDSTRNKEELEGCIAIHYPEKLFVNYGSAYNDRVKHHSLFTVVEIESKYQRPYEPLKTNLKTVE
jgi:hypothetical protein